MPNPTVPAAATGLPILRRTAKRLARVSIPDRARLERAIEDAIAFLDAIDPPDPDLEETGDSETSLAGAPSLSAAYDAELDTSDDEPGGDDEYSEGWSNPIGGVLWVRGRLVAEQVPDRQVRP